jgi:hypothetical protein
LVQIAGVKLKRNTPFQLPELQRPVAQRPHWDYGDSALEFQVEKRDEELFLCIPEGLGYPVTSELLDTAKRW